MIEKFDGVNICFNYSYPTSIEEYYKRMALFSGSGKKYSIMYFTSREEEKI
jgi:hypothetical protein